jgi:hypothetical protein
VVAKCLYSRQASRQKAKLLWQGHAVIVQMVALDLSRLSEEGRIPDDLYLLQTDGRLGDDPASENGCNHLHSGTYAQQRLFPPPYPAS